MNDTHPLIHLAIFFGAVGLVLAILFFGVNAKNPSVYKSYSIGTPDKIERKIVGGKLRTFVSFKRPENVSNSPLTYKLPTEAHIYENEEYLHVIFNFEWHFPWEHQYRRYVCHSDAITETEIHMKYCYDPLNE